MTGFQYEPSYECRILEKSDESENGVGNVKWAYSDAYLCQMMWNSAKIQLKGSHMQLVHIFSQGNAMNAVLKAAKKHNLES